MWYFFKMKWRGKCLKNSQKSYWSMPHINKYNYDYPIFFREIGSWTGIVFRHLVSQVILIFHYYYLIQVIVASANIIILLKVALSTINQIKSLDTKVSRELIIRTKLKWEQMSPKIEQNYCNSWYKLIYIVSAAWKFERPAENPHTRVIVNTQCSIGTLMKINPNLYWCDVTDDTD